MWSLSLLLISALAQGAPARPYSEERQLLDRHLAQLARPLPDVPTPADDAALIESLARDHGLRDIELGGPTITETGTLGQSRRVLAATSTYGDADRFFRAVQASPRLIDVESLTLRSAAFGVKIEARLRLYHRAARAIPVANLDPLRMRDRTRGATREDTARFARDEQLVLEKSIVLEELRRKQSSPRMFLAETGASFRDAAAALTLGSLDGDTGRFQLRGVVAGMGAADALERRLEDGFFRLREFSRAMKDGCYQFEVVGDSFRAGPQAALPLPIEEPFRAVETLCRVDRDTLALGAAGSVLRVAGTDAAGLSLRAADVDLADLLGMMETLTREPLVVGEEVRGRVSVDFANASLDDALRVLPVRVDRVGSVRLVRAIEATFPIAAAEENPSAARSSLRVKRGRGEDALSALAEAEPAYVAIGPTDFSRVSVHARSALVADLRRAVLAALRLEETVEDGVRTLRTPDRPDEAVPIAASGEGRFVFRARDLAVDETALAAVGRSGSEFVAFVYSPLGDIVTLRASDTIADGVVAEMDANSILVDTSEGPVRISLALARAR